MAHARIVARLRERGYPLDTLRDAANSGRLAYGYLEDLFPAPARTRTLSEAAEETGLEPALIERIWATAGFPPSRSSGAARRTSSCCATCASVLDAGSRSWRSCSSCACTARRWRRSPTPR